jgi:hypothetical protein
MDCIGLQALTDSSESEDDNLSISSHSNKIERIIVDDNNELVSRLDLNDDPNKRVLLETNLNLKYNNKYLFLKER